MLFVLLGGLKLKAQWAALISLGVWILVALIVYSMPVGQTLDAAAEGAVFGFYPIMWIVINAIWVYNLTRESGHFAVLRRSFSKVSDDQRVQAVLIAFCFGALLEALAGFGTPVAICSVMLIALGFKPVKAAAVSGPLRERHEEILVHTGQHYDDSLSRVFFAELGLGRPERELEIGGGSNASQTSRMLTALEPLLGELEPDATLALPTAKIAVIAIWLANVR